MNRFAKWVTAPSLMVALAAGLIAVPQSASAAPTADYGWDYYVKATVMGTQYTPDDLVAFTPEKISGSSGLAGSGAYSGGDIEPNWFDLFTRRNGKGDLNTLTFPSRSDLPTVKITGYLQDYAPSAHSSSVTNRMVETKFTDLALPLAGSPVAVRVGSTGMVQFSLSRVPADRRYFEMSTQLIDGHDPGEPGALEVVGENDKINGQRQTVWGGSSQHWDSSTWGRVISVKDTKATFRWTEDFYEVDDLARQYLGWMNVDVPMDGKPHTYTAASGPRDVTLTVSVTDMTRAIFLR